MVNIWVELLLDAANEKFLDAYIENVKKYATGIICIDHKASHESLRKFKRSGIPIVWYPYNGDFHETFMRGKALELARNQKADYIVIQDADELMSEKFCELMPSILSTEIAPYHWVTCPWVNFWDSETKVRVDGYWFPEFRRRIKVMKTDKVVSRGTGKVHYGPNVEEGPKLHSEFFCKHYGYMDALDRIRKNGRWADSGINFFADYENQVGGDPILVDWIEQEPYEDFLIRAKAALHG